MLKATLIFSLILGFSFVNAQKLKVCAKLEKKLHEISGMVFLSDSTLLCLNDGGNAAEIHEVNLSGKILRTTTFSNANNFDWEELQRDSKGFIYIGDIGNNKHARNQLSIYKFHESQLGQSQVETEVIHFYYEDQQHYPPREQERNFDAEAFLVQGDSLFIFSKDWSKPFQGNSKVYYVPNKPGKHKAIQINTFKTNNTANFRDGVTGICWMPGGLAILTYSAVYLIRDVDELLKSDHFVQSKKFRIFRIKQFESIAVNSQGVLYIATERHRILGKAKLYKWEGISIK
jgi:hypothetical protein